MAASAYHVISKEVENQILFLDPHMCINSPHWQSSGILIFLCKYSLVISDTLVDFFLDVLFLLLAVILSELYKKPRRNKDWVTEKSAKKNLCEQTSLFWLHVPLLCHFLLLSLSILLPKRNTWWMVPIKIHDIAIKGKIS